MPFKVAEKDDDPLLYIWEEIWSEGKLEGFSGWANVKFKPLKLYDSSIWFKYEEHVSFIPRLWASSDNLEAFEFKDEIKSNRDKGIW